MKISLKKLEKLEERYAGYLEGERLEEFFREFDIKFAAGHWTAGDFLDRFAGKGYWPNLDSSIEAQVERIAAAGVKGIEFQDSSFLNESQRIDEDRVTRVKELLDRHGLTATTMGLDMYSQPEWKLGSVTSVDPKVREKALERLLQAAELAKQLGCETLSFWPGQDGWDYNFEVDYGKQLDWFLETLETVAKRCKQLGLKFGVEAKLKEPKEGNMIIPTTHLAGWLADKVNRELGAKVMGVTIDYGHEQMYGVEPAFTVYVLHRMGVPLVNVHINTAKLRSNDEDRIFGVGDVWRFIDYLYATIDTGYEGWYSEDQFTYRMDPVKGIALSKELFGNLMKKALAIYARRKELEEARESGDQAKVINAVKKIILNF